MYLSLRFLCSLPPARLLACVGCVQHVRRLPPGRPLCAKAVATCVPTIQMQPERYMCLSGQVVSLLRFRGHPSPFSSAWRLTLVCTCRLVAGHRRTVHANKPPARSSVAAISVLYWLRLDRLAVWFDSSSCCAGALLRHPRRTLPILGAGTHNPVHPEYMSIVTPCFHADACHSSIIP
jgi:hypothetical protein